MKKSIKLFIVCTLLSSNLLAQVKDSVQNAVSRKAEIDTEYGRNISFGMRESTAASATATAEELSHKTSINPSNMLYGLIPGLQVMQSPSNAWSDGANLYVRGQGTLSGKNPLILVDGFERSIDQLSADEIESVTVLKDAVSTSLYGVKGANGVIVVKTKRGMDSAPIINFGYQFNVSTPNRLPNFVDGHTYANAMNEALRNDGLTLRYSSQELDAFKNQTHPDFYPNVDWVDEALRDHSYGDNVNFSVQGGGKFVKYYTQLNFLDDRGLLQPTADNEGYSTQFKYSKLNIRTNLDITVSKSMLVKLNLLGNFSEHNRPGESSDNIFSALYRVPAGAFPIKTKNQKFGGTSVYENNPIGFISGTGYARSQGRTLFADMELIQNLDGIAKGLSFGVKVALDSYATYWDNNTKKFGYESANINLATGEEAYKILRNEGTLSFGSSVGTVSNHFNFETRFNYENSWGKHKLNATLLYAMDKTNNKGINSSAAFMDVVGQVHYAYNNRYLLDASLSGSASSVLEPGRQWGLFPSVGAGWVLSEESGLKTDWLNLLKLRASYGIAGRANYGLNLFKNLYGGGNSYFFKDTPTSQGGMRETQIRVDNLTYEKSHKLNVGIDLMAFNKLSFTIDAFYDHRTDILVSDDGTVSSILGITAPATNNGIVDNYGVEIGTRWNDRIGQVDYQIGAQFSFNRNEISNMNEVYRPYDYLKRTGQSLGQIYGFEVIGTYQNQQEIDNREVKQLLSEVRPGDLMYKDQNDDKVIDEFDATPLGYNNVCPEIYYSFDLGAEYKGVGFYAQLQGTGNYSKVLNTPGVYTPLINNGTISQHYYDNRWTEETPNAKYPRLTSTGSANNYTANSLWVSDASFLKLRTLEVYYQLSNKALRSLKVVKKAKLFARAHDLFSLDKIDLLDPESVGPVHPTMTQYTFGINLSF